MEEMGNMLSYQMYKYEHGISAAGHPMARLGLLEVWPFRHLGED
jgi:hypothetical protein